MDVPVSGNTQVTRITTGDQTQVKKVVVGTPVRRVQAARIDINEIQGFDLSNLENGSLLIYNDQSTNFEASRNLEEQNINGGSY